MKKNYLLGIIVTILIVSIGFAFAYFVSGINIGGEGSNVTVDTENEFIRVIYDAGNNPLTGKLMPGDTISKDFTVTVIPTDKEKTATYAIYMDITENTFVKCTEDNYDSLTNACTLNAEELTYTLKDNDGVVLASGDLTGVTGKVRLAKETKTVDTETTFNYTLEITFEETNADQNHNQNKTINGDVIVEFANEYSTMQEIIAGYNKSTRSDFSTVYTASTTNTVFTANDGDGTTYYFAGAPTDNYVSFAGFYWRIIRVNGDGSIRLIYQGTSATATGDNATIGDSAFNSSTNRSEYVGLKYTEGSQYGTNENSRIYTALNTWYEENINIEEEEYTNYIDTNAGFCGDRDMESGSTWESQPSSDIYYAAYGRLITNKSPVFTCSTNNLYTATTSNKGNKSLSSPIGLITADEVAFAGGVNQQTNEDYYLHTGSTYWTMSPYNFYATYSYANVFFVSSTVYYGSVSNATPGVRPVINLKADTQFTGSGTSSDPFVVV